MGFPKGTGVALVGIHATTPRAWSSALGAALWIQFLSHAVSAAPLHSGSITGVVRDAETGAALPGAVIVLIDLGQSVPADSDGRYLLSDLPAGPQHLMVGRIGYEQRTLHALVPREGTLVIDITLRPRPILIDSIDVEARIPARGLEDDEGAAFPDRGLSMAAVRHHPNLSEPDVLQAAAGGEVGVHPESPSGLHVRGGPSDQIAYQLDGFPILNPYAAGGVFSAWNPDALSRIDLFTTSSPPPHPDALSGVLDATTRPPARGTTCRGGVSSTQMRATLEGPLGPAGITYLLSLRSTFPGLLFHKTEDSNIRGEGGDWLSKIDAPLWSGRVRLLAYGTHTELDAASTSSGGDTPDGAGERNALDWDSRSFGAGWTRQFGDRSIHLRLWNASGSAGGRWAGIDSVVEQISSSRRDFGFSAVTERAGDRGWLAGVRAEDSRTTYRLRSEPERETPLSLRAVTPVFGAFLEGRRPIGAGADLSVLLAGSIADGVARMNPGAQLRWKLNASTTATGGYIRRNQFAQSLRNPESVVATIFPVDLYMGADAPGIPVASSDLGHVGIEHHPAAGVRLAAQTYSRASEGLALAAPAGGDPFATASIVEGSDRATGVAVDVAASGARYAATSAWGYRRVRVRAPGSQYTPEYGAAHSIDAGVIYFPTATSSIRIGMSSLLGRRTTASFGRIEWEACNLLDQGCEFSGTIGNPAEPLGATRLPPYFRLDLGLRKHWHVEISGRDCLLSVFGAATNLLGRRNVLTVVVDPSTGQRTSIEMRPRSPLVAGIEWQF